MKLSLLLFWPVAVRMGQSEQKIKNLYPAGCSLFSLVCLNFLMIFLQCQHCSFQAWKSSNRNSVTSIRRSRFSGYTRCWPRICSVVSRPWKPMCSFIVPSFIERCKEFLALFHGLLQSDPKYMMMYSSEAGRVDAGSHDSETLVTVCFLRCQERCDERVATQEGANFTGGVECTPKGVLQSHSDT